MAANHYATLGVAPSSPRDVIRAAYLRLMRRYHPDKNPSVEAAARVRAITAAYAVLSVAEERAKYDLKCSQRAVPEPAPAAQRTRLHRAAWPALIAAGAAILVLVANVVPAWVVPEKSIDRSSVGGKTITAASLPTHYAAPTPGDAASCSSDAAAESLKRELFRRAALVSGNNVAALDRIAASSLVRFASPVARYGAHEGPVMSCRARVVLQLPPDVTAAGGRQSLEGIVAYSLSDVGAGGAAGLSLTAEPAIVKALVFLADTSSENARDLEPLTIAEPRPAVMQREIAPTPALASLPLAEVRRPQAARRIADQKPSSSCSGQRSWAEWAVCASANLAALDRAKASLWSDAMQRANASQRQLLLDSGQRFVAGRNQCSSEACVRHAYLADMSNIREIMFGTPLPR